MNLKSYTNAELDELRSLPKRVTNPCARWSDKPKLRPGHRQRSFQAVGEGNDEPRFSIYQRQSLADDSNFSCGIAFLPRGGRLLTLARYNGPSHEHGDITYLPHVHRATEQAIAAGKKPESEAEVTDRFTTLEGALACLIEDFNLRGLTAKPDMPRLPL